MKTSDITDEAFLAALNEAIRIRRRDRPGIAWATASRWDVGAVLAGHPEHVGTTVNDYPHMPHRVVLAKARSMKRRGLIDGCMDGCRGDFEIVNRGEGS